MYLLHVGCFVNNLCIHALIMLVLMFDSIIFFFFNIWGKNDRNIIKITRQSQLKGESVSLKVLIPINWLINPRIFM